MIIDLSVSLPDVSAVMDMLPSGGKIEIPLPPIFPPLPEPPSLKTKATSVGVRVTQTCPGYPACGRSQACVVTKSSKVLSIDSLTAAVPIPLPGIKYPSIPNLSFEFKMPSLGFSGACPNSQKAVKAEETANQIDYPERTQPPK